MELWESRASASKNIPDLPLGPHVREGWREAPGLRLGCSSTPWLPVPVSVLISVVFAGRTRSLGIAFPRPSMFPVRMLAQRGRSPEARHHG